MNATQKAIEAVNAWVESGGSVSPYISHDKWMIRREAIKAIKAAMGTKPTPSIGETITAWRATNNRDEAKLVANGVQIRSKDFSSGETEDGMSVAQGLHYAARGYKYVYAITAIVIGFGADGEPVIDTTTATVGDVLLSNDAVNADLSPGGKTWHKGQIRKDISAKTGITTDLLLQLEHMV